MTPRSMRNQVERQGGFTLVELLVVIVILGVLSGIVTMSVRGVSNASTQVACYSDIASVRTAEEVYYAQHDKYTKVAALVAAKLLRSAPRSSAYKISVKSKTGAVKSSPACSAL